MTLLCMVVGGQGSSVSGRCQEDQQSMLLQLKKGFNFNTSLSQKLARWDSSIDCCRWPGIRCDPGGHVIGLDLSGEMIMGGLDDAMAMFNLQHLQVLDLSFNNFNTTVPTGIGNLTYLRYLNLSSAGFYGQIPAAISGLTKLVGLDLSMLYFPGAPTMKLENPNLLELVKNLAQLVDLRLDGRIDSSLSKLQSLSVIRLDSNEFSSPIPDFFAEFRNLTVLRLSSCLLNGEFPETIFQVPSLELLDLSNNGLLHGVLPDFPQNHSMQTLLLSGTNFSGMLPASMGNLGKLSRIELEGCNFNGPVPKSMEDLTQLVYVDLASNHFTGPIPSLEWESFQELVFVDLRHNAFSGSIPSSLFAIPSLQKLQLSFNQLRGWAPEFTNVTSSVLDTLDLSSNSMEGSIPRSIFELRSLKEILLSSNRFNGSVQLNWIRSLQNLTTLDLSYNNLTIDASGNSSTSSSFPQFGTLKLASSNLRMFPKLGNQTWLANLDLSDNNIEGILPRWILESTTLSHLNLSHNHLTGLEVPISLPRLIVLDMHDNQLQGDIPIIPSSSFMAYVDYSRNFFNGSIPAEISNYLSLANFFSLSNNSLTGAIPTSICTAAFLGVLDLSNNKLNDTIPNCLMENINNTLAVLNLRDNKLSGNIPDRFQESCSLETLDLSKNQLEGSFPKSLSNCTSLKVLDLGNNRLSDGFPCLLESKANLRVLILRNNNFHGGLGCPHIPGNWRKLQIIDLAFNKFSGQVNSRFLTTWEAMMGVRNRMEDHIQFEPFQFTQLYYQDSTTVTTKGLQLEFLKILTVFTSIDFSSNNFEGSIPETLGKFSALYVLNFSNNAFTGQIPTVLGNLSQLESLDLSNNELSGQIPQELARLTFLSALNLSNNHLAGSIPTGSQLQTFDNSSFGGNPGLCGIPLSRYCIPQPVSAVSLGKSGAGIQWTLLSIEFGGVFGLAAVILPAMLWPRFQNWYWPRIDSLIVRLFPRLYVKDRNRHLRQRRRRGRRSSR
ncbi:Receptor-like protein 6 [Linum perenne]